jgi:hypothetical protein
MRVSGVERESFSTKIQYREYLAGVNNFIDEASQAAWNVWTLAFYRSSLLGDDGAEAQTANVSLVDSGSAVTLVCIRVAIGTQGEFLPFSELMCTFVM